jgi:death-on-curing protein
MTVWIESNLAIAIHRLQIAEHGGSEGIRDIGLLESALARPRNLAAYDPGSDIAAFAAAYGFGVIKDHPFIDGNKRTGYVILETFLVLNGFTISATEEDKYPVVIALADGSLSENELAAWLRERLVPERPDGD